MPPPPPCLESTTPSAGNAPSSKFFLTEVRKILHPPLLFIFLLFSFEWEICFIYIHKNFQKLIGLYRVIYFIQNTIPGKGFNYVFEDLCVNFIKCLVCYITNIFSSVFSKYICTKYMHYWHKWSEISLKIILLTLSSSSSSLSKCCKLMWQYDE